MRTEFLGTSFACRQARIAAEAMGANPEDFPGQGKDLLLSGKVRLALHKFRKQMKDRGTRRNVALQIASGGLFGKRTRGARAMKTVTHTAPRYTAGSAFMPGISTGLMVRRAARARQ